MKQTAKTKALVISILLYHLFFYGALHAQQPNDSTEAEFNTLLKTALQETESQENIEGKLTAISKFKMSVANFYDENFTDINPSLRIDILSLTNAYFQALPSPKDFRNSDCEGYKSHLKSMVSPSVSTEAPDEETDIRPIIKEPELTVYKMIKSLCT